MFSFNTIDLPQEQIQQLAKSIKILKKIILTQL